MASHFRRIMEECGSVAEVDKLLRSVKRTTMGSLTICDKKEGVVFEVTTKTVALRRAEKGVCVCTNHFVTEGLAKSDAYREASRLVEVSVRKLAPAGSVNRGGTAPPSTGKLTAESVMTPEAES